MKKRVSRFVIKYLIVTFCILGILFDLYCVYSDIPQDEYRKIYPIVVQIFSPSISLGVLFLCITYFHRLCFYNWIASGHLLLIPLHNLLCILLLTEEEGNIYDDWYMNIISIVVAVYLISALIFAEIKPKKKNNEIKLDN